MSNPDKGVADLVDVEDQLAEWRRLLNNCLLAISSTDIGAGKLIEDVEYALYYNPEQQVQQLRARVRELEAKVKQLHHEIYQDEGGEQ